ncbi:unnamed protein product (macronuclear) [Paramecium tetraurelia]|uniref:Uncharacterized protein n=1 Tax=Paramecium tetraurelia TaxID=5888 RepID=A0DYE5_PARTE|nr:uncharacterized protein GSPATT00003030001 [Paramecium tetraurelia]CAK88062.1 unnamed protein product [Paramecium tetraurelia]|eukprot:XP_001455459.1 hypothetical protein (macronuclear) [Paramecium tetraurelia strain d4-2]
MWNFTPASKICQVKSQMKSYDQHLNSVRNAKSIVKTNSPYKPYFLSVCSRHQNKYEQKEINQCNSILISKIVNIDLKQGELNKSKLRQKFKLNSSRLSTRRSQNLSIDFENIKLYDRIQSAKTSYNKKQQLRHSSEYERYSKNISQNARRYSNANISNQTLSKSFESKSRRVKDRSSSNTNQHQYSDYSNSHPDNQVIQFLF